MVVHDNTYPFALGITGNHISPEFFTSSLSFIHDIITFKTSKYINQESIGMISHQMICTGIYPTMGGQRWHGQECLLHGAKQLGYSFMK